MKNLENILQIIGTLNFNDLVLTVMSGDEDWLYESLSQGEDITVGTNYINNLCSNHGYTTDNFPFKELFEYCRLVSALLENVLIIPIPESLKTKES